MERMHVPWREMSQLLGFEVEEEENAGRNGRGRRL